MTKVEQYIEDYKKTCSNEIFSGEYESWLTPDQVRRVAEIAKEEAIEKVLKIVASWEEKSYTNYLDSMKDIRHRGIYWTGFHVACEVIKSKIEEL